MGGEVIGLASIIDRTAGNVDVDIISAIQLHIDTFDQEECPLCKEGLPYVKPGSRKIK